jgi:uncharacterized damage-inducible protein DinB
MVEDLKTLFDYSYWANDRLCGVLSQLTTEQFTQPVAGSYGSIRNTMVHILSAEWVGSSAAAEQRAAPPSTRRTIQP